VDRLADIYRPKKITHLSISFLDIDAGEPELLSAQALAALRTVEVLALVLRGFADDYHPAPLPGWTRWRSSADSPPPWSFPTTWSPRSGSSG